VSPETSFRTSVTSAKANGLPPDSGRSNRQPSTRLATNRRRRKLVVATPGTDVMIFKIFSPKNLAKSFAFFAQTTVSFCKNCDHNIGF
jgi:hypothetical protein